MSHTPAPWFLGDGGHLVLANSSDCLAILCDTQGDQFASMNTHSVNTVTPEQRRANGLVMAAAPDLLAACEAAEEAGLSTPLRCNHDEPCALCMLRAAIKKAKGE